MLFLSNSQLMKTAHFCQQTAYDPLLMNRDMIYFIMLILQYVVTCCKSAYLISLIFLNKQQW